MPIKRKIIGIGPIFGGVRRLLPKSGIALVTANFGRIDTVKPLPSRAGIDAIYYTDIAGIMAVECSVRKTWTRIIKAKEMSDLPPRLRSRFFKQQIHRLPETKYSRWLVWADSAFLFKELQFIKCIVEELERLPMRERMMVIPHPHRRSVREEIDYVIREIERGNEYLRIRYGADKAREAAEDFARRGFSLDEDAGLWCGGFWIVENNPIINQALDAWWMYVLKYGVQDQYFLPVVIAEYGVVPKSMNVNIFSNEYFHHAGHSQVI